MKHVSILIPTGDCSVVNIMGSFQLLTAANGMHTQQTGYPLLQIDLVAFSDQDTSKPGTAYVRPTKYFDAVDHTDVIIIPAVHNEPEVAITNNSSLISFIENQYKKGATLASLCVGSYLLAATGLLNGKICSTHWLHAKSLQDMFPEVLVKEERMITDQQGIITSGGAYAFTNLILYLVEKLAGREIAVMISKTFMIDPNRTTQSVYAMFKGVKEHADPVVTQIQNYIEEKFNEKFTIDQLAQQHHLVRRTLERRFKSAIGHSIISYTQQVRIEAAKKYLERGRKSITEVMYDCGYSDTKAFRDVFKKLVGISPLEYRQKYIKEPERI